MINPFQLIKKRIILSNGMLRSGSTWLYNAMRIILEKNIPEDKLAVGWMGYLKEEDYKETTLLKIHSHKRFIRFFANQTFYSYRDIRDVIASRRRIWGTGVSARFVKHLMKQARHLESRAVYVMRYEDMIVDDNKMGILQEIEKALGYTGTDLQSVLDELNGLTCPKTLPAGQAHDNKTLLHENHITNGRAMSFEEDLTPDEIKLIQDVDPEWFTSRGYKLVTS